MKKLLLVLSLVLITLPRLVPAEEPRAATLDGFLDVPWGADPETAKKQLVLHTYSRFNGIKSAPDRLHFDGGKFAEFKVEFFELFFTGNQFYRAAVHLFPLSPGHEKEFATFKQLLTEKYGPPKLDETKGKSLKANWDFPVQGSAPSAIEMDTDPKGIGLRLVYISAATRDSAPKAGDTSKGMKPPTGAKKDL